MKGLPAPLEVLQQTRVQMRMGHSLLFSLRRVIEGRNDPYSKSLKIWLLRVEAGQPQAEILATLPDLHNGAARKTLLNLFEKGLKGASIDEALTEMEGELIDLMEVAYERHLQVLPLKLLAPLTLFILPSVMILIVGPLFYALKGGF